MHFICQKKTPLKSPLKWVALKTTFIVKFQKKKIVLNQRETSLGTSVVKDFVDQRCCKKEKLYFETPCVCVCIYRFIESNSDKWNTGGSLKCDRLMLFFFQMKKTFHRNDRSIFAGQTTIRKYHKWEYFPHSNYHFERYSYSFINWIEFMQNRCDRFVYQIETIPKNKNLLIRISFTLDSSILEDTLDCSWYRSRF